MKTFPTDIDGMKREKLEILYLEAVYLIKEALGSIDDKSILIQDYFGCQPQEAHLIALLMDGRCRDTHAIAHFITHKPVEELVLRANGQVGLVSTRICFTRKILKPYGIKIKNYWGQGYGMEPNSIKKLRALLGLQ